MVKTNKNDIHFAIGHGVFAKASNTFYFGFVIRVDDRNKECYVTLENETRIWVPFSELYSNAGHDHGSPQTIEEADNIACLLCRGTSSDPPNEIILCDNCGLGFHQMCHNPVIGDHVLKPEVPWSCRLCDHLQANSKETNNNKKGKVNLPSVKNGWNKLKSSASSPSTSEHLKTCHESSLESYQMCEACGEEDMWFYKMLMCKRCRKWFHCKCIPGFPQPSFCGNRFFMFVCKTCNQGQEYLRTLPITWCHLAHLALFNLSIDSGEKFKKYHDVDDDIMPWIFKNWSHLHIFPGYSKYSFKQRREKVLGALRNNPDVFKCGVEIKKRYTWFALRELCAPPRPYFCLPTRTALTDKMADGLTVSYLPGGLVQRRIFIGKRRPESPVEGPRKKRRKLNRTPQPLPSKLRIKEESPVAKASPLPITQPVPETKCATSEGSNNNNDIAKEEEETKELEPLVGVASFHISSSVPRMADFKDICHPFKTSVECADEARRRAERTQALRKRLYGTEPTEEISQDESKSKIPVNGLRKDCVRRLPKRPKWQKELEVDILGVRSHKDGTKQYLVYNMDS